MTVIIKNFQLGHKFDASRQLRGLKFVWFSQLTLCITGNLY
jgi:hypothetical protein